MLIFETILANETIARTNGGGGGQGPKRPVFSPDFSSFFDLSSRFIDKTIF